MNLFSSHVFNKVFESSKVPKAKVFRTEFSDQVEFLKGRFKITFELYLAIICTFHYLQMSEQKTELFANNAKDFFVQKSSFFEKN